MLQQESKKVEIREIIKKVREEEHLDLSKKAEKEVTGVEKVKLKCFLPLFLTAADQQKDVIADTISKYILPE